MSTAMMTMVFNSDVQPAPKRLVLLAIADNASDEGICWPKVSTIARKSGLSESSVQRWMAQLESEGVISREKQFAENGRQTTNMITIDPLRVQRVGPSPSNVSDPPESNQCDPPRPTSATLGGPTGWTDKRNRSKEPSVEPKNTLSLRSRSNDQPSTLFEDKIHPIRQDPFDEFWATYPRHVSKKTAHQRWKTATKRTPPQLIIDAARRYAEDCHRRGTDPMYIAHPATWLNQERFLDEPAAPHVPRHGPVGRLSGAAQMMALVEQLKAGAS